MQGLINTCSRSALAALAEGSGRLGRGRPSRSTMGTARGARTGRAGPGPPGAPGCPLHPRSPARARWWPRRHEGDAEKDRLAVGDPSLDAAGAVGPCANLASLAGEGIVVLRALEPRAGKSRSDLEAASRRKREHRLHEISIQLVENRLAPAGRRAVNYALDHADRRSPSSRTRPRCGRSFRALPSGSAAADWWLTLSSVTDSGSMLAVTVWTWRT